MLSDEHAVRPFRRRAGGTSHEVCVSLGSEQHRPRQPCALSNQRGGEDSKLESWQRSARLALPPAPQARPRPFMAGLVSTWASSGPFTEVDVML